MCRATFSGGILATALAVSALSCAGIGGGSGGGQSPGPGPRGPVETSRSPPTQIASAALGSLTIRKWRLDNGLEIITVPDPGARSVTYLTVYRVGSRDENGAAGQTGLAHLFEHLMFTGAPVGTAGDFDQQMEEVGGTSNAMTYYDFTSYIDEVPPHALPRAIRVEADRMLNLQLGEKKIANERDVVIQERLGSIEDAVDGTLDEMVWGQAFQHHPYRWPIIGRMADIKTVTREQVLSFYHRHYAPNRAVVVVTGRFDEPATVGAIQDAYGVLPKSPDAEPSGMAEAVIERAPASQVRARIQRPVAADRLVIGYPAPGLGDADRATYEVMNELLTGGPSSRLYRLLVLDREIASSITGEVAPTRDFGLWCVWTQMTKGTDAARAEDLIQREVERLTSEWVTAPELAAAKNRLETNFWADLASSHGRAEALGHFDVTTGDFRNLIERSKAYARVTPDDVARVARAFLGTGARSVVIATPVEIR